MQWAEMIVLVVLIVTIGRVLSGGRFAARRAARRMRGRHGPSEREPMLADDTLTTEEAAELKAELARMRERVAVLERIATDPARRLSDQIDELGPRPRP